MIVFYDNWCKNCSRFVKLVHRLDWLKLVSSRKMRDEYRPMSPEGFHRELAEQQVASLYKGKWKYGYDSLYRIFLRLPLFWPLIPVFWILKVTRSGQFFYKQLAVRRHIIPLHCDETECDE